jgi:transcriptional regulator with XRE-family HTH domain
LRKRLSKSLYTPEWEALCEILKRLRKRKRLSQVELSVLLRQPQSFVSKVESGQRKLDLRQFTIYVKALDSQPMRIFRKFLDAFEQKKKK